MSIKKLTRMKLIRFDSEKNLCL